MKKIIDLHCDTMTLEDLTGKSYENPMFNTNCVMDFNKVPEGVKWTQMHAIFMPDELRGQDAIAFYEKVKARYDNQLALFADKVSQCKKAEDIEKAWAEGKFASVLTIEGGSALAGYPNRAKVLAEDGVKIVTLVWNGENEIASGHDTTHGMSPVGKEIVSCLEENNIIVDVSHLNDVGFEDLLKIAKKPFVATHSNARAICPHLRNLTDDMIKEMVKRDCLIGLNYYMEFLCDSQTNEGPIDYADMLYRHICHFFDLGAEKNLALGSDFDGAELPDCLSSPSKVVEMYDYLLSRGLTEDQLDGIFYGNALRFLKANM